MCHRRRRPAGSFLRGQSLRVLARQLLSDADTEITLASIDRRPMSVRWLERHFKHMQAFVPLSGKFFIMVLAPATEAETPDLSAAKALLFDGSAGFILHIGTWHEFPFALIPDTRVIVVLRNESTKALLKEAVIDGEAYNGDLDKKNIQAQFGVTLQVRL